MDEIQIPSIFPYLDYRVYLKDTLKQLKSSQRNFTYRLVAKRIGLKSPDYLSMILDGKRNLVRRNAICLSSELNLKKKEKEYFLTLVEYNQAKEPIEKEALWAQVMNFSAQNEHIMGDSEIGLFKYWFILALYELISFTSFENDPRWISNKLYRQVGANEIKLAMEALMNAELIAEVDGKIVRKKGNLFSGNVPSEILRNYHAKMLDLAKIAIFERNFNERVLTNTVLSIHKDRYKEYCQLIEDFQKDIMRCASSEGSSEQDIDCLYQLSVQFFPLSDRSL